MLTGVIPERNEPKNMDPYVDLLVDDIMSLYMMSALLKYGCNSNNPSYNIIKENCGLLVEHWWFSQVVTGTMSKMLNIKEAAIDT